VNQLKVTYPDKEVAVKGNLYKLHRRPIHPEIIINDSDQGVQIIDPWREEVKALIPFIDNYRSAGTRDEWCFQADGKTMLILSGENRMGYWLSLEGDSSYKLECPPMPRIADLRYVWDENSFWITGGKSHRVYKLEWHESTPRFREVSSIESRRVQRGWRRTLDSISLLDSNVLRVEPEQSQMLYHSLAKEPAQIGVANWSDEKVWTVSAPKPIPTVMGSYSLTNLEGKSESVNTRLFPLSLIRLASFTNRLFIMYEHEVYSLNENGQIEITYPAPENFRYIDLDTIPAQSEYPAALVIGCKSIHGSNSKLLIYELET
jgi:hypothetical protein